MLWDHQRVMSHRNLKSYFFGLINSGAWNRNQLVRTVNYRKIAATEAPSRELPKILYFINSKAQFEIINWRSANECKGLTFLLTFEHISTNVIYSIYSDQNAKVKGLTFLLTPHVMCAKVNENEICKNFHNVYIENMISKPHKIRNLHRWTNHRIKVCHSKFMALKG